MIKKKFFTTRFYSKLDCSTPYLGALVFSCSASGVKPEYDHRGKDCLTALFYSNLNISRVLSAWLNRSILDFNIVSLARVELALAP